MLSSVPPRLPRLSAASLASVCLAAACTWGLAVARSNCWRVDDCRQAGAVHSGGHRGMHLMGLSSRPDQHTQWRGIAVLLCYAVMSYAVLCR